MFHSVRIASGPVPGHHGKEPGSVVFASIYIPDRYLYISRIPPLSFHSVLILLTFN